MANNQKMNNEMIKDIMANNEIMNNEMIKG